MILELDIRKHTPWNPIKNKPTWWVQIDLFRPRMCSPEDSHGTWEWGLLDHIDIFEMSISRFYGIDFGQRYIYWISPWPHPLPFKSFKDFLKTNFQACVSWNVDGDAFHQKVHQRLHFWSPGKKTRHPELEPHFLAGRGTVFAGLTVFCGKVSNWPSATRKIDWHFPTIEEIQHQSEGKSSLSGR